MVKGVPLNYPNKRINTRKKKGRKNERKDFRRNSSKTK